ncbi:MAG TPA: hypothetical protein VII99_08785 [Bacteroidia bacterium]
MATSTVPIGNAAGLNQSNPVLKASTPTAGSMSTPGNFSPIPSGSTPNPNNPYMLGSGSTVPGATSSGTTPSGSSAPTTQDNLTKQLTDIYGKGVGGSEASLIGGMSGTDSAAFQQLQTSMAPVFAKEEAELKQTMGAAGISPNSSVEALGLADLGAQQSAELGGWNANMIMQNQDLTAKMLGNMQGAAASEVATSGWTDFATVMGDIGKFVGDVRGTPSTMDTAANNPAFLTTPAVQEGGLNASLGYGSGDSSTVPVGGILPESSSNATIPLFGSDF